MDNPATRLVIYSGFADAFHVIAHIYDDRYNLDVNLPITLTRHHEEIVHCGGDDNQTTIKIEWFEKCDNSFDHTCFVGFWYPISRLYNETGAREKLMALYPAEFNRAEDDDTNRGYVDLTPYAKSEWEEDIDAGISCLVECGNECIANFIVRYLEAGSLHLVGKQRACVLKDVWPMEFHRFSDSTGKPHTLVCEHLIVYIDSKKIFATHTFLDTDTAEPARDFDAGYSRLETLFPHSQIIHLAELESFIKQVEARGLNTCKI